MMHEEIIKNLQEVVSRFDAQPGSGGSSVQNNDVFSFFIL